MMVLCGECGGMYDDEFLLTICPHQAFPANDGNNNFALHEDSVVMVPKKEPAKED
jgi:hypothetical protein